MLIEIDSFAMFRRIPYTQEASPLFFEAPKYQTTMHRTRNPSPLLYSSEKVKEIISGARVFLFFTFWNFQLTFSISWYSENYFLTKRYSEYVYKSLIPKKQYNTSLYIYICCCCSLCIYLFSSSLNAI